VPGFLPLQHWGDALRWDHGHPPQAGHHSHPRGHRGPGSQAGGRKAKVLSATVSRSARRWFVSFTVEVEREVPERHRRPKRRVASRWGSRTCGGTPRSQLRGDPLRLDALHKATTRLASRYETVGIEDLNVAGMLGNRRGTPRSQLRGDPRRLARSLSDQSFGRVRRLLGSKTVWRGGRLITSDRFHPSSKTCSAGGMGKAKRSLAERVYRCEGCGLVIDRDVNAARNLLKLAGSGRGETPVEPREDPACAGHTAITGVPAKPASRGAKQEPGTARAGKTGTATGQPVAVDERPLLATHPQRRA
jgi:putative transposase